MRDRRKFCRPKVTKYPEVGDVKIVLNCGQSVFVKAKDFKKIKFFFNKFSFVGEANYNPGNILVYNYNSGEKMKINPSDYNEHKFLLIEIIGSKKEGTEGDIIAYNSILELSAVFSFDDFENISSSWKITSIEGIDTYSKSQAVIGDVLILAYNTNLIINPNNYNKISSNWDVIGIVCIESKNTPDKKLRILSLDYMDYNNPISGNSGTGIPMMWGASGNISGVLNKNQVPCMSNSNDNILTEDIQRAIDYSFIPTNYFTGTQSSTEGYKYNPVVETNYAGRYCPPAYLNNGNLNPQFIATQATIPGTSTLFSINNALSDFNGLSNTQNIMKYCTVNTPTNSTDSGNYPAVLCCSMYNKGGLEWYLPASGEMACVVSNFNLIDLSRVNVGYVSYNYTGYWYWTSTPHSSSTARSVNGNYGRCNFTSRSNAYSTGRVLAVAAF